jgi:hypothetical protein
MRAVTTLMKTETSKLIYFAYFHFIVSYGIFFLRKPTYGKKDFTSKRESSEYWKPLKGKLLVGNYLKSLISIH